jgi:hypothetical protein
MDWLQGVHKEGKGSLPNFPPGSSWDDLEDPEYHRRKSMKKYAIFWAVFVILAFQVGLMADARAEVVGRLTQAEGRVDLLKGGKLPATPVKVGATVAATDVIRTKSLSRAQITFIDNTILTIAPESRIAIEEYIVDTPKGKRQAVLEIFRGTALAVINKIFKVKDPDFVIKTHTAVMGVRGTEFGIRIQPNSSSILNFKGLLQVGNIFPEVSQLFQKAFKVAYASPWRGDSSRWVFLKDMQGTTVARDLPPTLPYAVTEQDREMFMRRLSVSGTSESKAGLSSESVTAGFAGDSGPTIPVSANAPGDQTILASLNTVTVPPTVVPEQQSQGQSSPTPPPPSGVAIPVFNILTVWGSGGRDLDLHLTGPEGESTFHVYYASMGSLTGQPYAMLHADDTGYSGSEVITVQQYNQGGPYQVYVFNYGDQDPNSTNLSTASGVTLQVINGGTVVSTDGGSTVEGGTVVASLSPTAGQAGNTWIAVTIDPATGEITEVNQITNPVNGDLGTVAEESAPATSTGEPTLALTASAPSTASDNTQPEASADSTAAPSTTLVAVEPAGTSSSTPSATSAATDATTTEPSTTLAAVEPAVSSTSAPSTRLAAVEPAVTATSGPSIRPRATRRIIAAPRPALVAIRSRGPLSAALSRAVANGTISAPPRGLLTAIRPRVPLATRVQRPVATVAPRVSLAAHTPTISPQLHQPPPQQRNLRRLRRLRHHVRPQRHPMPPTQENANLPNGRR